MNVNVIVEPFGPLTIDLGELNPLVKYGVTVYAWLTGLVLSNQIFPYHIAFNPPNWDVGT